MPRVLKIEKIIHYSGVILLPKCSLCTLGGLHREHSPANFLSDFIEQTERYSHNELIKQELQRLKNGDPHPDEFNRDISYDDESLDIIAKHSQGDIRAAINDAQMLCMGKDTLDGHLLEEMDRINKVAEPDLALLVIDGTIGQQCFNQAEAFHKTIPVGGVIGHRGHPDGHAPGR